MLRSSLDNARDIVTKQRLEERERREREEVGDFLAGSVDSDTAAAYDRAWTRFLSYLNDHEENKDPFQVSNGSKYSRVIVLVRFCRQAHSEGLRDEQIKSLLRGVRFKLQCLVMDDGVFDDSVISRCTQACRRTLTEALALRDKREVTSKICVPQEVMLEVRDRYWVRTRWDWEGALDRMVCAGLLFGRSSGLRPGNWNLNSVKRRNSGRDHNIKTDDVQFVRVGGLARDLQAIGDSLFVLSHDRTTLGHVSLIDIEGIRYRVTTKTTGSVVGVGGWRYIGRVNETDDMCVKVMLEFSQHSGALPGEYFFSVRRTKTDGGTSYHKALRTVDSTLRLKAVGSSMGIPPARLSLKSLRKTYGTVFEARHLKRLAGGYDGAPKDPRENWSAGSRVPFKHYSQMMSIGVSAVDEVNEIGDVTIEHVQRIMGAVCLNEPPKSKSVKSTVKVAGGSASAVVGGALPVHPEKVGLGCSNSNPPDSDDSESDSEPEDDVDESILEGELKRLYPGDSA